ncbi:hypothetical protein Bca4012_069832 [Brassica carinata]
MSRHKGTRHRLREKDEKLSQPKDRYEKKLRRELRRNSSTVLLFTLPPWICKVYPHQAQQLDPEAICLAGYMRPLRREKDISIHEERSKERQNERGD